MQLRLSRTIQPRQYESAVFDVTVDEADIPELAALEAAGPLATSDKLARLHFAAYKAQLAWEVFHKVRTEEQAIAELLRFKVFYGTESAAPASEPAAEEPAPTTTELVPA